MIGGFKLYGRVAMTGDGSPRILRVGAPPSGFTTERSAVLAAADEGSCNGEAPGARLYRGIPPADDSLRSSTWLIGLPDELGYLTDGDVIRLNPADRSLYVLYRRSSRFNSLLLTERCNSYCVMCSQPPRDRDDGYLVDELLQAIPLMDPATPEIGFTGGEPTLLGDRFLALVDAVRTHLPDTALHILSNGRLFAYPEFARRLAAVGHKDLMIGVPLYSDIAWEHDWVVQASGAFDQTIRGLINLGRYGVPVEIRVVLHRGTIPRLPHLARFLCRNLPFASHVALMGLEIMGHTKMNLDGLWIDPADYQHELQAAVHTLSRAGMRVSIYNHQLCTLDEEVRPFAVRSISDWKNTYLPECSECLLKRECGGFFASSNIRFSSQIHAIRACMSLPTIGSPQ